MNDERPTELLSALPRSRPHRRSDKRGAAAATPSASTGEPSAPAKPAPSAAKAASAAKPPSSAKRTAKPKSTPRKPPRPQAKRSSPKPLRQPAQPRGIPDARRAPKRKPAPAAAPEIVGTAVQAVGELAEIGLTLTARALRNAVARLPKP